MSNQEIKAKLASTNLRLKNLGVKLFIVIRGSQLWGRGILPPKPWLENRRKPYQQYLRLGKLASATDKGLVFAEKQVKLINTQLELNTFRWEDWVNIKEKQNTNSENLIDIWDAFVDFKKTTVSINTVSSAYTQISNYLKSLKLKGNTEEQIKILNVCLSKDKTDKQIKRYADFINQALKYSNLDLCVDINVKNTKKNKIIHTFSVYEKDLILQEFRENKKLVHYYPLVFLLFNTGCRPCEACALRKEDIKHSYIHFNKILTKTGQIQKGLKTQENRHFPLNRNLKEWIEKNLNNQGEYIFTGKLSNSPIQFNYFSTNVWQPTVKELAKKYQFTYHSVYHCRHFFITQCLEKGIDPKDIANWVGNSPEMIYKHYASVNRELVPPDLN